ncbi:MAG: DUF3899 domain-containing protein [Clostridia bacterium]|nr:DUF3899 domain-containing protein [Clostridia bacterium]
MKPWKVRLIKYGITGGIGALMAYLSVSLRGITPDMPRAELYRILCDAFTIPGSILLMVGLLVMISNAGTFTGLGYAAQHLKDMLVPFSKKKHESYYDYYERKRKQGKVTGYGFIFITGAFYMAIAMVFYALFYSVY